MASWILGIKIRYFKSTYTVQLPCKNYFISHSNKTSRKKQQTNFLMFFSLINFKFEKFYCSELKVWGSTAPFPPCERPTYVAARGLTFHHHIICVSVIRGLHFIIMLVVFQMFAPRRIPYTLKKSDLNKSSVGDRLLYLLLSESGSPPPRRGELRLASLFRRLEVEASKLTTVSFFQLPLVFLPPFFPIQK